MNRKTGINSSVLFLREPTTEKKAVKKEIIFAEHGAWILTHFLTRGKGVQRPINESVDRWSVEVSFS